MSRPSRMAALVPGIATAALLVAACGGAADVATDAASTGATSTKAPTPTTGSPSSATPSSATPSTLEPTTSSDELPEGFGDGPAGSGIDRFYDQQVDWSKCGSDECANVWVPLDYSDPDGQAITLSAKRDPADDQSKRRGSLLINPGGPGGSGVDFVDYIPLDSSITDVYDVVGFDPRGVARSTPVDCLSDEQLDGYIASDPTPDDEQEVQQLEDLWSQFTAGCEQHSGDLLAHLSTVEVARDMDVLSAVVGDDKLDYLGASYGTYIGATYAGLFPDKVDRMVLDGAVDPQASPKTSEINQAAGFETALTAYLEDCVRGGDCPLGDDADGARERLIALFKELDSQPLPTSSGRELAEGLAFLGVILPLYNKDNWSYLTSGLQEALSGSGDTLLLLADSYSGRQPDGSYSDNSLEVQPAVSCLDHPEHESVDQIEAEGQQFVRRSPVFGPAAMWWPYACSNWPESSTEEQPDFSAAGAPPIVVVGTTRDPATPYQQAVDLARELDSGVLLTRDGDGHTSLGAGNDCIDSAISTYLVKGKPPKDGTTC